MPPLLGSLPCRSYRRQPWRSSRPRCRPSRCRAPRSRRRRRHAHRPLRLRARRKPPAPTEGGTSGDTIGGAPAYTIGNAVSVVTGEELRAQQVRNAAEALRSLPGVAVGRSGGVGNFTQVRIRGAEGNHTLVLVDGIEANNIADGEFDFSNLSAEDIERIEVIRGPMSGLYGSNAVGGVVNIITRTGKGPLSVTVRTEAGSMGTRDVAVRASGGSENAHLAVSYAWRDTGGFNIAPLGSENDGSRLGTLTVRGGAKLLPGVTLDFTVRNSIKSADRDGFGDFLAPAGSLATAYDDRSTLGSSRASCGRQPALGSAGRQVHSRDPHRSQWHGDDGHRPLVLQLQQEHQRERQSWPISPPTGSTRRGCGPSTHSPAASRRRTSASRPRATSPTGGCASAAASPIRANGAAASPSGCS